MPPTLSRHLIKLALCCLLGGTHLGAWMLWSKAQAHAFSLPMLHAHISLMSWGWMGSLAWGFAIWIFPRRGRQRPRLWLAWAGAALWACALGSALLGLTSAAAALRAAAALLLIAHLWPRIKAFGR